MPTILRTPQANRDLLDIWLYIASDNIQAADQFLVTIEDKCHILAPQPELGRPRPELAERLRSFPVASHIIFYRPIPDGIEIHRVLSGSRDLPPLFE